MAFLLRNVSGGSVDIDDLGITIPAGETYDITEINGSDIAISANSGDVATEVNAGNVTVVDPLGGPDLDLSDSLLALLQANNPHYGMPPNAFFEDIANVNITGSAPQDTLMFQGGEWTNIPTVPFVPVILQGSLSTQPALGTTFSQVVFDTTDNVTSTSDLELVGGVIQLKTDGWYKISYFLEGQESVAGRAVLSGTATVISGSATNPLGEIVASFISDIIRGGSTKSFYVEVNGAQVNIDIEAAGAAAGTLQGATFIVEKMEGKTGLPGANGADGADGQDGADGADGLPGSGTTMNVEDEGVLVTGSPFDRFNFTGAGVTLTPNGSTLDINIPVELGSINAQEDGVPVAGGPFDTVNFTGGGASLSGAGGLLTARILGYVTCERYGSVTQTFTTTPITLLFGTAVREDSPFSYSNGEVTVSVSGWYEIEAGYSFTQTGGNNRTRGNCEIEVNGSTLPGSYSSDYSRNTADGYGSCLSKRVVQLTAGDAVRARAYTDLGPGTLTTVADSLRLNITLKEET